MISTNGQGQHTFAGTTKPHPHNRVMTLSVSPMRILLAGVLTRTGQLAARTLDADPEFRVYALCSSDMRIVNDEGPFAVKTCGGAGMRSDVPVNALVVATDDAPPVEALRRLLEICAGVDHCVLLSRLGASAGSGGLSAWKAAEDVATADCPNLTILRVGEPLLGGPYYKLDIDQTRWRTSRVIDNQLAARVARGDQLSQGGFGASRIVAASAIASVLRRGSEARGASYSVVCSDGEATTPEEFDALFELAAATRPEGQGEQEAKNVQIDLSDDLLLPFTQPFKPPPPSPLELLKASFFGTPAVAGPNWFTLVFFVGGMYQCTLPEYIERTGIDVFGLAPGYGIVLGP